jgi:hypothetical protein
MLFAVIGRIGWDGNLITKMLDVAVATLDLIGSFWPAQAYGAGPLGRPMGVHFVSSGKSSGR